MVTSTTLTNPNPLLREAHWCRYCIHLRILNLNHLNMAEVVVSEITPSVASPTYKIASKYTYRFKSYLGGGGHTDRQTGDLINLLSIFGKYFKIRRKSRSMFLHEDMTK
jgi:hypothetical protein